MVRVLSGKDLRILSIMAPEFSGEACQGSGTQYKSLLPPVATHYSRDAEDFGERIGRLSDEDIRYLAGLMLTGEESLHCLPPEYFARLETRILMVAGAETAKRITSRYAMECV